MVAMLVDVIAMVFRMPRALFPEMAHRVRRPFRGWSRVRASVRGDTHRSGARRVFGGWVSRIRRQGMTITWLIVAWGAAMAAVGVAVGVAEAGDPPWRSRCW